MKTRTHKTIPPNPSAERSLIVGKTGIRLWDFERKEWVTPVVIAEAQRDGIWLLGLNERAGAVVEIREA